MSTPVEQARAIAQARRFLLDLCLPGKIKRVPRAVRLEARARVKHLPMSWDLPRIVEDEIAMEGMEKMEEWHRKQFWEECGVKREAYNL
jgi:hypothetical protein